MRRKELRFITARSRDSESRDSFGDGQFRRVVSSRRSQMRLDGPKADNAITLSDVRAKRRRIANCALTGSARRSHRARKRLAIASVWRCCLLSPSDGDDQ